MLPSLNADKINKFWEIAKHELDAAKTELTLRDRDIEEAEEHHQACALPCNLCDVLFLTCSALIQE